MDKHASLDIRVIEKVGQLNLSPDNYDIKEIGILPRITPSTQFIRTSNILVDVEMYFYGTLTNAGGMNKANIHIDTEEYGTLTVTTDKDFIMGQEENFLYKKYGIRALGKQNIETGELDKSSLSLLELIDYSAKYDETYLKSLIQRAKGNWSNVDSDAWLSEIRGENEASAMFSCHSSSRRLTHPNRLTARNSIFWTLLKPGSCHSDLYLTS